MNKSLLIIFLLLFLIASYLCFTLGVIIFKIAIGAILLSIFSLGFIIGRITKK